MFSKKIITVLPASFCLCFSNFALTIDSRAKIIESKQLKLAQNFTEVVKENIVPKAILEVGRDSSMGLTDESPIFFNSRGSFLEDTETSLNLEIKSRIAENIKND
ncbi:MAG: hypothetical protein LBS83_01835 [Holosporales bacterium]|jgi:hypothetical protein|nr:hypothetical protein [Holosporales bacterium]